MAMAVRVVRPFFRFEDSAKIGLSRLGIWGIVAFQLVGFIPILDFLHLLGHLFSAAQAAYKGEAGKAWKLYVKMLKLAWGGKVKELEEVLKEHALRVVAPPEKCPDDDPRKLLARAIFVGGRR